MKRQQIDTLVIGQEKKKRKKEQISSNTSEVYLQKEIY